MEDKIYISIPDFWNNYNLNIQLIDLWHKNKDYFYDNIIIDSCYGSFPTIFNGGRVVRGYTTNNNIINTMSAFNERGISIRHTFTNLNIQLEDLNDKVFNNILKFSVALSKQYDIKNGINIADNKICDYVLKFYPELYIMYSTTLNINKENDINSISENNLIVPSYSVNNDFHLLQKLKYPNNIELLIGEACIDNCPNRKLHHKTISNIQYLDDSAFFHCPYGCENKYDFYNTIPLRNHYISYNDIISNYLPLGINKFKISGRSDSVINVIERYVLYLIKPEYKDKVRNILLSETLKC